MQHCFSSRTFNIQATMAASTPFIIYSAYSFLLRYQKHFKTTTDHLVHKPDISPNILVDHLLQSIFHKEARTNKTALQDAVYSSVHEFKDVDRELFMFYIDGWSTLKIMEIEIKMLSYIHETLTGTASTHEVIAHLIMVVRISRVSSCFLKDDIMYFKYFCTTDPSIFLSICRGLIGFEDLPPRFKTHPLYDFFVTTNLCQCFCGGVYEEIPQHIANDRKIMALVALHTGKVAFENCGDLLIQDKSFFRKVIVRHHPYWLASHDLDIEKYRTHLADKKIIMQTLINMQGCPFEVESIKRIHPSLLDDEDVVKLILSIEPEHIAIVNPRFK